MTEARTITLTLTPGQYDALSIAAFEGADSPDLAAARDALEQAWADAARDSRSCHPGNYPSGHAVVPGTTAERQASGIASRFAPSGTQSGARRR